MDVTKQVEILKAAVAAIKANPAMLHQPELGFMKAFIEGFGGKIPKHGHGHGHGHEAKDAGHGHDHGHAHDADGNCPGGHGNAGGGHGHGHGHGDSVKYLNTKAEWDACLEGAQASGKAVIVDFTATWCGPCKQIGPKFEAIAAETPGAIFVKVDVDKNAEVSQLCGIKSMPTFQVWRAGNKIDEMSGADEAGLRALVNTHSEPESEEEADDESEEEAEEADDKLVEPDEDPGEQSIEPSNGGGDDAGQKAGEAKMQAQDAMSAGDYSKAVEHYSTALTLMTSPLTFAKRAECFLSLSKPVAAVRDCDAALKLNPDSAKSMKVRGMAKRMLGQYQASLKDLSAGQNADFDERTQEWLDGVKPKANRVLEKQRKGERKAAEKEKKAKLKRVARARKEYESQKAAEGNSHDHGHAHDAGGNCPSGHGNAGGGHGHDAGGGMDGMMQMLMQDPEVMALLSQPGVGEAISEIMSNPQGGMAKYQNNPAVMAAFQKIQTKLMGMMGGGMGGGGGMPGMTPGGMGGMGGAPSGFADDID